MDPDDGADDDNDDDNDDDDDDDLSDEPDRPDGHHSELRRCAKICSPGGAATNGITAAKGSTSLTSGRGLLRTGRVLAFPASLILRRLRYPAKSTARPSRRAAVHSW